MLRKDDLEMLTTVSKRGDIPKTFRDYMPLMLEEIRLLRKVADNAKSVMKWTTLASTKELGASLKAWEES